MRLNPQETTTAAQALRALSTWFNNNVAHFFEREGLGDPSRRPPEWKELYESNNNLVIKILQVPNNAYIAQPSIRSVDVPTEFLPLLKRALIIRRRDEADRIRQLQEKTHHLGVLGALDEDLRVLDQLTQADWFRETVPLQLPRAVDLVPMQRIEEFAGGISLLQPRKYDEKFHILLAPELFLPDLECYRRMTDFRGTTTSVAFVDIDNFKSFNSDYSETQVDRILLPRFMQLIEAHLHLHGFAYRQGGDEYLIILPGLSPTFALAFLDELRGKISRLTYPVIDRTATVSIGMVSADPDCHLTNRELQQMANLAKERAKGTLDERKMRVGKNRIAFYKGNRFTDADLEVVAMTPG